MKHLFGYDDSLDVFGVHGVGGIVGAILTGVFAAPALGGTGLLRESIGSQVMVQAASVLVTIIWSAVVSGVTLFILDKIIGLRVSNEVQNMGLDLAEHNEDAYSR